MKDFLNEIIRLWWVEGGLELKNPKSEASIKALRVVLKEDLEFSNDVIEYIVENIKTSITHFASEPQSSGINVGKNQSAVSAQLHPDWDDEDLNEDDEEAVEPENDKEKVDKDIQKSALTAYEKDKLKKEDVWVKNKKSGSVYPVQTANPETHIAPSKGEISKAEKDKESKKLAPHMLKNY